MILKSNPEERISQYLEFLFKIKKEVSNLTAKDRDFVWLKYYNEVVKEGYTCDNLPRLLALIHPDFYYSGRKSFENNIPWRKDNQFTKGITETNKCQAGKYTKIECIFNSMRDIRGKCEADHHWPNSLGGPSILSNRLILCRYHNSIKTNNTYFFNWNEIPSWLKNYLEKIYRLKV